MDESIPIGFDYTLEEMSITLHLNATVIIHHRESAYVVREIRTDSGNALLPDLHLKKLKGHWVHTDSEKATRLSLVIGRAIEQQVDGYQNH